MKTKMSVLSIALGLMTILVLQIPAQVCAQGVELGDVVVLTAEVVEVDYVDRELQLLGPGGNILDLEVGEQARNFDQIQVGDQVKVTYYESVALYLGKKGQAPDVNMGVVATRSPKGDMPAGAEMETVDVSAQVKAIDMKNRTVTLELPDGKMVSKKVDKSVQAFDTLQVGDSINVRYTEALAISVEKPLN
jgi:hypothetical protein